jgi:phospholipase/lecithinase/hemolysin
MFKTAIAAFAAFIMTIGAQSAQAAPFTGFVGFGDSFSDKGRFDGYMQPPSNGGRFTDGITWMEILSGEFAARGQGNFNMALGGATAGPENANADGLAVLDVFTSRDPADLDDIPFLELRNLSSQIGAFATAGFDALVGDNPLVTIFIGGNDFIQDPDPTTVAGTVINGIAAGILQISALGTQFNSFMIANLPDLSIQPMLFSAPDAVKDAIRAQSISFNALLAASLADLSLATGLEIETFDLFSATDAAYAEARAAGLILDDTCVASLNPLRVDLGNNCLVPGTSANYLFMDNVHPGDFAHSRWGDAAVAQVADRLTTVPVPVPLPAGLPMMLAGLVGFALLRMRRAV